MSRRDDPYYDRKIYHFAAKFTRGGNASALCYKRHRVINLDRGQSWTIRPDAVTCPKCRKLLKTYRGMTY
jgi:hypothetical protein